MKLALTAIAGLVALTTLVPEAEARRKRGGYDSYGNYRVAKRPLPYYGRPASVAQRPVPTRHRHRHRQPQLPQSLRRRGVLEPLNPEWAPLLSFFSLTGCRVLPGHGACAGFASHPSQARAIRRVS